MEVVVAIPLDTLINRDDNVYELTCVAIKRAAGITKYGDEELDMHDSKVVSAALTQVLENRVEYFFDKSE